MSNQQHRRSLNVEARILNEAEGLVEYVASDATLDSYQESVLPSGWRFNLFKNNSPFVDSHNYWSIEAMLGKVVSARIEGSQLIERVQWAKDIPEHKLATIGWKLTVGGFLKAVSVGFRAINQVWNGEQGWNAAVAAAGLLPDAAAKCRRIFLEQEQLELSACVLGANPSAVAKALKEGCVREADLAAVGFGDEDFHFLSVAGAALDEDKCDLVQRLLIQREMGRITSRRLSNTKPNSNSLQPSTPDGGEEAQRQVEQRAAFLHQLEALTR